MIMDHNINDLFISFSHAVSGKLGYVFNGFLDAGSHNAVPSVKFTAELIHLHSQGAGFYCRGDLGRAACLSSITDYP